MDLKFLDADELRIEQDIRNIQADDPLANTKLLTALKDEASFLIPVPTKTHSTFRTINSELSEVWTKLPKIDPRLAIRGGDPSLMKKALTKLLHLQGRINRISRLTGKHEQVDKVRATIDEAIKVCLGSVGGSEISGTEEGAVGGVSPNEQQPEKTSSNLQTVWNPGSVSSVGSFNPRRAQSSLPRPSLQQPQPPQPSYHLPTHSQQTSQPNQLVSASYPLPTEPIISPPPSYHTPLPIIITDTSRASDNSLPLPTIGAVGNQDPVRDAWPNFRQDESFASAFRAPGSQVGQPLAIPPSHAWVMAKWPLRFSGSSRDLPIDEFVFRVETLARLANLTQEALTLGLHQILAGSAASWYWVFIRNEPYATWPVVRAALIAAFQSNVSDVAIRRLITDRLQRPSERFMEFCIAIQEMEVRLTVRMGGAELLEVLRRNMLPHMQDRLLFVPVASVAELQQRVQQIEELSQRQAEVQQTRRAAMRIHEIAEVEYPTITQPIGDAQFAFSPPSTQVQAPIETHRVTANPFSRPPPSLTQSTDYPQMDEQIEWVCAIDSNAARSQYTICWNCDEMGHSYMDCTLPLLTFCFGCGTKNEIRPKCPKCSARLLQGNGPRNVRPMGPPQPAQTRESQTFRGVLRPPHP